MNAKKVILILLSAALLLSGCSQKDTSSTEGQANQSDDSGEEESEDSMKDAEGVITVGDTITTDYYEITLTSIGYADATVIPTEQQSNMASASINSENLLLPMSRDSADLFSENGYEILSAVDGYKILYFSFDYAFVGKETVGYPTGADVTLEYLDYSFSNDYYIAHRIVSDGETGAWRSFTDYSVINRSIAFFNYFSSSAKHNPFEDYTMEARGFISIPDEVAEDEAAIITLSIDESYSKFHVTFSVDSQSFENYLSQEDINSDEQTETGDSLDTAIENFLKSDGQDYFRNHVEDYAVLSGDEIAQTITSKENWDISEKNTNGSTWSGKFAFESDGNIKETIYDGSVGYFNSRTWKIEGDAIALSHITTKGDLLEEVCEVRLVKEGVYLLLLEGEPFILME